MKLCEPPYNTIALSLLTSCWVLCMYLSHLSNYKLPVELALHYIFVQQVNLLRYNSLFFTVKFPVSKNKKVTVLCNLVSKSGNNTLAISYVTILLQTVKCMDLLNWLRGMGCAFPMREFLTRKREWKHKVSFSLYIVVSIMRLDRYFGIVLLGLVAAVHCSMPQRMPQRKGNIVRKHHHCQLTLSVKEEE